MLNAEQRKNRLEDLLARVRRNRGRLEDSDSLSDVLPAEPVASVQTRTYDALPDELSSIPASPVAEVDDIPRAAAEPSRDLTETSAATALDAIPTLETEPPEPVTAKIDFDSLATSEQMADYLEPADDAPQIEADTSPEEAEDDEELERETLQPAPAIEVADEETASETTPDSDTDTDSVASGMDMISTPPVSELAQTETEQVMRRFETRLDTSSGVISLRGEVDVQWSLRAVLERAWKLGMKE